MAREATTTSSLDSDMAKELEDALDIDLFVEDKDGGLDVAGSIADFEAQISRAAEDLARDSRAQAVKPGNGSSTRQALKAEPTPASRPEPKGLSDLRPVEAPATAAPSPFTHANDDRQKDYRTLQQQLRRSSPGAIYWMVSLLSLAWIAGGVVMGHVLFAPDRKSVV